MFCEKAYTLVKDLSRCEDNLPPYNNELVTAVNNEIKLLIEENQEDAQTSTDESNTGTSLVPTMKIRHAAVKRNIRCLMAYHYNRIKCLRNIRWEFGSILPADIKSHLSASEIEWFSKYSRTLAGYMRSIGEEGVNLAVNLKPPKALYVEVRCLVDYGKYELNDGSIILLKKDSRHYLPRSECEELIRQGIFQHIV
ncbi:DNA replication complex GINS protein PSF1-like [Anoplophora glabripennis]|uniref:DNA replication complex GINS protein PSF1-like n=1 Tax=Anoplophora glabripennis TaxID=217634 RepID=UPI0008735F02|nr:DNA replication complex GINS protein PSF1-like [Anoplophora glabripennis]